jgi:hypothetical protein
VILWVKMRRTDMAIAKETASITAYTRLVAGFKVTNPHYRLRHLPQWSGVAEGRNQEAARV